MPKWTMTRKATSVTMEPMFAPYCATCRTRRLLTLSHVVASDWERGGSIHLRCTCGTVVDADARPPSPPERQGLTAA